MRRIRNILLFMAILAVGQDARAQTRDVTVAAPTRLDWAFAAQGFGAEGQKLPAMFDSTKQRYQLHVPKAYQKTKAWPLILFVSASAQPAAWSNWKGVCEKEGVFFCSPYAAGNTVTAGPRTRIVLDVLDDVRRSYRIDPGQTYISGFSGGGRMACAIGFALPEVFGGVVPICGTNPIGGPAYLRHRAQERLSIAFVTGEKDFNRKENEIYMAPWFEELGIRSKLWVAANVSHAVPPAKVLEEVYAWLAADLQRRQSDAEARPGLVFKAEQAPSGAEQATRFLDVAQRDLKEPKRIWHGVTLLQGIVARWSKTAAGNEARGLLKEIVKDEKLLERIGDQGAEDEIKSVSAQAKALERFGQTAKAIEAWSILAKNYEGSPPGQNAQAQIRRLRGDKK
jgi:dienelactone hydrolase